MTTPTPVAPSKAKTYVALAGSVLSFVVPLIVSVQDLLPPPWPAIIGGIIAVLTALGVYRVPYAPPGTVVVPESSMTTPPTDSGGGYVNPWRKRTQ